MSNHSLHNDEAELYARIANDDELAFNELFHLYHKRFYAAAIKMTRSQEVAEEIVQDVFVTLWQKRAAIHGMEKPFAYLFTVLYNGVYKHLKQLAAEKKRLVAIGERHNEIADPLEDLLLTKENEALLQRAVHQLPEQQRQVYVLIKQQGYSREEAANLLGISPNTVRNHLREAVKNIRMYVQRALPLLLHVLLFNN